MHHTKACYGSTHFYCEAGASFDHVTLKGFFISSSILIAFVQGLKIIGAKAFKRNARH